MAQANPYSLRIEADLMERIKHISDQEGRSVNKQIEYILREFVKRYDRSGQ